MQKTILMINMEKTISKSIKIIPKSKKKIQDAHECIRPSYVDLAPEHIEDSLSKEQFKLYKLIWERFIATMMADAIYDSQNISASIGKYIFKTSGSKLKFDGFMKVYSFSSQEETILPDMKEESVFPVKKIDPKQHFTQPPRDIVRLAW